MNEVKALAKAVIDRYEKESKVNRILKSPTGQEIHLSIPKPPKEVYEVAGVKA